MVQVNRAYCRTLSIVVVLLGTAFGPTQTRAQSQGRIASGATSDGGQLLGALDKSSAEHNSSKTRKPVNIETAALRNIQPGVTTEDLLKQRWGPAKEIVDNRHVYDLKSFKSIDVFVTDGVVSTILVQFDKRFAPESIAKKFKFDNIKAVTIYDEEGRPLGQTYPERGVSFGFDPQKQERLVANILIEPVSAETFFERARADYTRWPEQSRRDLKYVLSREPQHAGAHIIAAKIDKAAGEYGAALAAIEKASQAGGDQHTILIIKARILAASEKMAAAKEILQAVIADASVLPHLKARAVCELGNVVGRISGRNYKESMQLHMQAIELAGPLVEDPKATVRRAAKNVLVDAHLGAAYAIAWGNFKKKPTVVPKWLAKASEMADDLVKNERHSSDIHFRVARLSLAALAAFRSEKLGTALSQRALEIGNRLIASADDPILRRQLQWKLALAMSDAIHIADKSRDHNGAIKFSREAIANVGNGAEGRDKLASHNFVIGQIYFRTGAAYAVINNDHRRAIKWYDKALSYLKQLPAAPPVDNPALLGENFVSMGVSFWAAGQKRRAVQLTALGSELIKADVDRGSVDLRTLSIPYDNLASMHKSLGDETQAAEYIELAQQIKNEASLK